MSGDVAALTAALDADPTTLNTPGPGGWPALHLAGHFGHLDSVELLLARGANIELRSANDMQNMATHATAASAVPEARAPILERLLAAGIPVDATQHGGFTQFVPLVRTAMTLASVDCWRAARISTSLPTTDAHPTRCLRSDHPSDGA